MKLSYFCFLANSGLLASVHCSGNDQDECTYALEVVQVQDGSSSFGDHVDMMRRTSKKLVESLRSDFGEFKYGVTSFVDKPIPMRGLGYYGNYRSLGGAIDWCYRLEAPLSADSVKIAAGLQGLGKSMGSGGDYPENPYEGMVFAAYDKALGWSPPDRTHAKSGRPIARIMIVFTDDVPHMKGDAADGANTAWNWPREYSDYEFSKGGFGARSWGSSLTIHYRNDNYPDRSDYVTMSNLFRKVDLGGTLPPSDGKRLNELVEKFGPFPYPKLVDHPGDDSLLCNLTEFPTPKQVGVALRKHRITPIILLARPGRVSQATAERCASIGVPTDNNQNDVLDCLVAHYTADLKAMGTYGVVDTISSTNVLERMTQAIATATEQICIGPTTTTEEETAPITTEVESVTTSTDGEMTPTTVERETEPTTSARETKPTTTARETKMTTTARETKVTTTPEEDETTSDDAKMKTTSSEEDTAVETTSDKANDDSNSTEEETTARDDISTNNGDTNSVTMTTGNVYSEQTTSGKKASAVPLIAGATGGAIAGTAAVAGLLYKKFGLGMFGGQGTPDISAAQQVDVPETSVERETMEEVTMDMFQ